MQRETCIPSEFVELPGRIQYIVKRGTMEFSSSCPNCLGEPHPDGTYPDRFRMLIKSRATGGPLGFCRVCGYKWWPGKGTINERKPSAEQLNAWREEVKAREMTRLEEVQHALSILAREQIWTHYHDQLTAETRAIYEARGIPEFWIDYLQLGYDPQKFYQVSDHNYFSPSLTIPIFEPVTWKVLNVKHRLLSPIDPCDKYRPELRGLPASLFTFDPERPIEGPTLICEGEFKAIVAGETLDRTNWQVVGIPSKSPDLSMVEQLKNCDPIVVCLDPDAYTLSPKQIANNQSMTAIQRLVKAIGDRARVITLPDKIDDLINKKCIDKHSLKRLVDGARRIPIPA
jgi:hypothetical protein